MPKGTEKDRWTRRGFLGVGSAALAAAGMLSAKGAAGQGQESAQKPKTDRSRSDPGPKNAALDAANPDSNNPLATDAGGGQTFKYPFSFAHKGLHQGGRSVGGAGSELAVRKAPTGVAQ